MRVLFTVSDWPSHYYPMVPLGWALQAAGHEVRVACAPSQRDPVRQAGLLPVPLAEPPMDMLTQNRLWNYWAAKAGGWPHAHLPPDPVTGRPLASLDDFDFAAFRAERREHNLRAAAAAHDAVVAYARDFRPHLVVHDRLSPEGVLAARVLGVPSVLHLWGPHGTAEPEPELSAMPGDPSGSFPRYGVGEWSPDLIEYVIDPCPPGMRPPLGPGVTRLPVRYVPYNGARSAPAAPPVKKAGRTRVCLAWGNSLSRAYGQAAHVLPGLVEALRAPDRELLLLAPPDDLPARPGPGVTVLEDYPLHLALRGCDAVVHYGGAGCTMTAMQAAVPQVVVPFSPDLALNARRVTEAGAARTVPAHTKELYARVATTVTTLLTTPPHTTAARKLAQQNDSAPTPAQLATHLETALASHRTAA
ncbi:nucleotide disphospho-sugar-binding domain-containing protein [Streptomyces varsoviensis]|nr:nucleotide disphospho-sugar-binding domain-containing protein [Streptomyces varsoviensis]